MTISNQWVALYDTQATPALIGQSTDTTSAAIAAYTLKTWALATPYRVPVTGVYYASLHVKATAVPSLMCTTAAADVQVFTAANLQTGAFSRAVSHGSSLGATAPATLSIATVKANVPWCVVF